MKRTIGDLLNDVTVDIVNDKPSIIFDEESHTYTSVTGKPCISATKVASFFTEPFDRPYWLTYSAFKSILGPEKLREVKKSMGYNKFPLNMKPPVEFFSELHKIVEDEEFFKHKNKVKEKWKMSALNGTKFHLEREIEAYGTGVVINPFDNNLFNVVECDKDYDNQSLKNNLFDLKDGCYPELLVFTEYENVIFTGLIDEAFLYTKDGVRLSDTNDFKTNEKLGSASSSIKMKSPFNHLSDTKLVKYQLQASIYQYILKCHGFTPNRQGITHYKDYDHSTGKLVEMQYLGEEVEKMFNIINEKFKHGS